MHTTKKADGGQFAVGVAEAQRVHRHALSAGLHFAERTRHHAARCSIDQAFEPVELGQALPSAGCEGGKLHGR